MKPLVFFSLFLVGFLLSACERELKEHKVPASVKRELAKMKKKQAPEAVAKEVHGTIELHPDRTLDQPMGATLFLFVRPEGQTEGPPLAVKRYDSYRLPFEFSIGPADVMIEGLPFEGDLNITARLDVDGTPKSGPGDIEGTIHSKAGTKGVRLVLDTLIAPDPNSQVSGTISISSALLEKAPKNAALFIIARKSGEGAGGPPLAVKRITDPTFPLEFSIGQANTMLPGAVFEGEVNLHARLDQDGTVRSSPGDIEGRVSVQAGDSTVQLVLNSLVEG